MPDDTKSKQDGAHIDQGTLDALVLGELRYALGRLTWVPSESASHVRRFWDALSAEQRIIIRRDVAEHIELAERTDGSAWGDDAMLRDVWRPLLAWIDERAP